MVGCDRHRGRPARRWSHNIVDWCGCSLVEAIQLANDSCYTARQLAAAQCIVIGPEEEEFY